MKIAKTMFASAAALGLAAAPIAAQAAPARAATPVDQTVQFAGGGTILYVALAAFAIAMIILLADNDKNELPASP
jgi:hypothetical protein